jgi:vesicle-fusing ATPase
MALSQTYPVLSMYLSVLQAVDALTTMCGKVVPMKKLLLWLEMARQDLPAGTKKIPLMQWHQVLRDLSS